MQQVVFRIPIYIWSPDGIPIYGFGLMLFLAFLTCLWLGTRWGAKEGIPGEVIQDLALWLFLGGIIGARITYIIFHLKPKNVGEFFAMLPRIWDGGIILYGSIMGGLVGYGLYYWFSFRKRNISTLKLADVVAPLLAIGLCLGRVGCFLNGCCYGQVACETCPTVHFPMSAAARTGMVERGFQTHAGFTLSGLRHQAATVNRVDLHSPAGQSGLQSGDVIVGINGQKVSNITQLLFEMTQGWPRGQKDMTLAIERNGTAQTLPTFRPRTIGLHPTQLYESVSMFLILLVLLAFRPLKTRDGQVIALLMICYSAHRYLNEKLRIDARPEGFEKYVSILLFVSGLVWMAWLVWKGKQEKQEELV